MPYWIGKTVQVQVKNRKTQVTAKPEWKTWDYNNAIEHEKFKK